MNFFFFSKKKIGTEISFLNFTLTCGTPASYKARVSKFVSKIFGISWVIWNFSPFLNYQLIFLDLKSQLSINHNNNNNGTKQKKAPLILSWNNFSNFSATVWHEIFVGSNFFDFSSDPQKKVASNENYREHFSQKIYSRVNIL